jgi:ribosome biogenesis GTPase
MDLETLGWNRFFQQHFEPFHDKNLIPARVAREHKNIYVVYTEAGQLTAKVSGRFRHDAQDYSDFPSVGDWVAVKARPEEESATIHGLVPRKSTFSRTAVLAGKTEEQVLAANIDTVFLVSGLDGDFNLRRIERYVTIAWDSGATPVIVLNKADLCDDVDSIVEEVEATISGVSTLAVSAEKKEGLDPLREYLAPGKTVALLGSSGVGKSTIINGMLGFEQLKTGAVRAYDSKGKHTTTYREMILFPNGGIVIDTPGMREIEIWSDEDGLSSTFGDIEALVGQCRFNDCRHDSEPGCAIQDALADGDLDVRRFQSYIKLQSGMRHLAIRQDQKVQRREARAWQKKVSQFQKERQKLMEKGIG